MRASSSTPQRRPRLPGRPAVHRVVAGLEPDAEQPYDERRPAPPARPAPTTVASGSNGSSRAAAAPPRSSAAGRRAARPARPRRPSRGAAAARRPRPSRRTPAPRRGLAGRASSTTVRGRRSTRSAGEPDQNSPCGTRPRTAEPGATSASRPTPAPGPSVLRVPIRAPAPTSIAPMCSTSPSSQWPVRSTSGSTEQPSPQREQPGHRRQRVEVDVPPDRGARARGRTCRTTAHRPGSPRRSSSASRSASHRRRWILPPRG